MNEAPAAPVSVIPQPEPGNEYGNFSVSNLANLLSKTIGDLDLQCQGVISISGFTGNQTDTLLGMIANEMSGSED